MQAMPDYAELEAEMQRLWDKANGLLANYPFDFPNAVLLEQKLIGCAILAREANRPFAARQLESAAGVLAAKVKVRKGPVSVADTHKRPREAG